MLPLTRRRVVTITLLVTSIVCICLVHVYLRSRTSSISQSIYEPHRNVLVDVVSFHAGNFDTFVKQYPAAPLNINAKFYGLDYIGDALLTYLVSRNIFGAERPKENSLTIATQLSLDRFEKLIRLCTTYRGPVSAVIYVPSHKHIPELEKVIKRLSALRTDKLYLHLLWKYACSQN